MPGEWHGDEFFTGIRQRITSGVEQAALTLKTAMQELISVQGPPRSSPGEAPHKDTGDLYASIQAIGPVVQGDLVVASVGTDLRYGILLEYGTSRMAARPWLSRALRQTQTQLAAQIVGRGGSSSGREIRMTEEKEAEVVYTSKRFSAEEPSNNGHPVKLNIGSGSSELPGYTNIDCKRGGEAYPLTLNGKPFEDCSVESIYSSHCLEHFSHRITEQVLREWIRVLKPGGLLQIAVPDVDKCFAARAAGKPWPFEQYLMGGSGGAG